MKIFVDSDSCPAEVREVIVRAGLRTKNRVIFVANRKIPHSMNEFVEDVIVEEGADKADNYIIENSDKKDIAVTRDIPLAESLVNRDVTVINDRGTEYTKENIRERISVRNYMLELAACGLKNGSVSRYGKKELYEFSNTFDKMLALKTRSEKNG